MKQHLVINKPRMTSHQKYGNCVLMSEAEDIHFNTHSSSSLSEGMSMSWHDVSYIYGSRAILQNVTGSVYPSGLTALIGPNQSGKTTLLEVIASQFSREAKVKGEVRIKNVSYCLNRSNNFRSFISLVSEKSYPLLPADSSAREIIAFHVKLRCPFQDLDSKTREIISLIAIDSFADLPTSQLSPGDRMRLLIALELVKSPSLLLIDQPLDSLDVFDAYGLIQVLKSICKTRNVSVMFTASRLSSEVFFAVDRISVISRGSVTFQGPPENLAKSFSESGYPCPPQHSPVDFVMLLLQSVSWADHRDIVEHWRWSFGNTIDSETAISRGEFTRAPVKAVAFEKISRPPALKQVQALLSREYMQLIRSPGIIVTKVATTVALSFLVGGLFYQLGKGQVDGSATSLQNYAGSVGFVLLTSLFGEVEMVAATIPMTLQRFLVEYASGLYSSIAFFTAQIMLEIPQLALTNLCHLTVVYFLVGLNGNFAYWFLCLLAVSIACNSFGWLISCISKSTLTAMQLLPLVFLPQILFAGVIVNISLVPASVSWLQYFCYLKYIFNLVFLNEFSGELTTNSVIASYASLNQITATDSTSSAAAVAVLICGLRFIAAVALSRRARSSI